MDTELHILFLEDSVADYEMIVHTLSHGKIVFNGIRVETRESFQRELANGTFDIVLSDFSLPQFNGLDALKITKEFHPELPFMLVTGSQTEEVAVQCILAGADDYILKSSMLRLPHAIESVMHNVQIEREKRTAEEELKASEQRYRALIESSSDAVILVDKDGLLSYNSYATSSVLGYDFNELHGVSGFDLVHPEDIPKARSLMTNIVTEPHQTIRGEIRVKHKDGSTRWIEHTMNNMLGTRSVGSIVVNFHDISERKRAESAMRIAKERAEEYDKLKTNLISVFSLELRTPLETVLGGVRQLRTAMQSNPGTANMQALQSQFEMIERNGARLVNLVDSFFDVANIQSGNLRLKLGSHHLEPLVRQTAEEFRAQFKEQHIEFIEDYAAPDAMARIDSGRVAQILQTLLSNALKFTSRGSVTVRTQMQNGFVTVEITDTGVGIPKSFIPVLFTPFRQASEGNTRGFQGAGLRLSIARRLAEAMAGSIDAASVEGKGSTFITRFPVITALAPGLHHADEQLRKAMPAEVNIERRALMIEQGLENMLYVRTLLRTTGWTVATANDAENALRIMQEQLPTIILVDQHPNSATKNLDVLNAVRSNATVAHVPMIAIASDADATRREKIIATGFHDVIFKPFSPDKFREQLARHLAGH